jgi:EAL domain-containing protein (putative c-di-GMP-specific phosphodiesterase class I)
MPRADGAPRCAVCGLRTAPAARLGAVDRIVVPGEFIPTAERTGMIRPIGAWVLRQARADLARWNAAVPFGRRIRVAAI